MIKILKHKFFNFLKGSDRRSQKLFKNIVLSFGVRGGSIFIGLLLVPMTINYVNPVQYGIWLTVSSIISWMGFFDIGMGNGLRNKLANALAQGQLEDAKKYVSTTYATLSIFSVVLFLLILIVNPFISWRGFLNIPNSISVDIQLVLLIVLSSFCVQFVAQLLNTVLVATHEPALSGFISFLGQVALLITVFILKKTVEGNLLVLVFALTIVPIFILIVASIILYRNRLKGISPSLKYVDFSYAKNILNVGGSFFLIQIGALVLFQTDNIIITKVIGPSAVTEFNVAYKLFSVVTMIFTVVVTPYWSAFTDAYSKRDFSWMKKNIQMIRKLWFVLSIGVILLLFVSKWFFRIWLGTEVLISFNLSIAMAIYVIVSMWQTLHVYFLNGTGFIRLQLILVSLSALINIPMAIFFGHRWGLTGIISANTVVFLVMGIIFSIQVKKIVYEKAEGIWNK